MKFVNLAADYRFDDMRIRDLLCGMKVINMYRKSMVKEPMVFFMNTRSRLESKVCCEAVTRYILDRYCSI